MWLYAFLVHLSNNNKKTSLQFLDTPCNFNLIFSCDLLFPVHSLYSVNLYYIFCHLNTDFLLYLIIGQECNLNIHIAKRFKFCIFFVNLPPLCLARCEEHSWAWRASQQ